MQLTNGQVATKRSVAMGRIRQRNTAPEIVVRRILHRLGYRFRLHSRNLPGTPDIVFPARRAVIFVHGCFWHRHFACIRTTTPKTNKAFWEAKFHRNIARDARVLRELESEEWRTLVVWECQTFDEAALGMILLEFLGSARSASSRSEKCQSPDGPAKL